MFVQGTYGVNEFMRKVHSFKGSPDVVVSNAVVGFLLVEAYYCAVYAFGVTLVEEEGG